MVLNKRNKGVYGIGVNDSEYNVYEYGYVNGEKKVVWRCPFYAKWVHLLERSFSNKFKLKNPTYKDCGVCDEWLIFSNFKAWMETQDWEGKQLDKDLLIEGNKIYKPEGCAFLHQIVNKFIIDSAKSRGNLPIGVSPYRERYKAQCRDPFNIDGVYIGIFETPELAHEAWRSKKHNYSVNLANSSYVKDEKVKMALMSKYL